MLDVRTLRRKAGLTQLQLSQRSQVGRVRLSFIECGYLKATPQEEIAIHKVLLEAAEERTEEIRKLARQRAVELAG